MIRTHRYRPRLKGFWMKVRDGEAVRRWRRERGLTQDELAALCKCSQTTIHVIEAGKLTSVTEALAKNIARRLQVPWEELFAEQGAVPSPKVVNSVGTKRRSKAAA